MQTGIRRSAPIVGLLAIASAVSVRAAESSPEPALPLPRIVEPSRFLVSPGRLQRTIVLPAGAASPAAPWHWELRIADRQVAAGRMATPVSFAGGIGGVLSAPLPDVSTPAGLDLIVEIDAHGRQPIRSDFPFTLYPQVPGRELVALFDRSTVALFDPGGDTGGILASLGFEVRSIGDATELTAADADLILIGPGGFTREHESLGPILARRAAEGTPLLLLDQPSLAATLTDRIRLWPSFGPGTETAYLLATGHPALRGPSGSRGAAYLLSGEARPLRPYLPPTRGNFRVLAGVRVKHGPAWQEGVGIVEFSIGRGTAVAAQFPLASDYSIDPGARVLLINLLGYLLGGSPPLKAAFVYGSDGEDFPACMAALTPAAPTAPIDLRGVDLLLVPADWQAPRRRERTLAAPLADVARFLNGGGTVLLIDPQPLVADYLGAILGEGVVFEPFGRSRRGSRPIDVDDSLPLLQGVAIEDLELLGRPGEREFLLRSLRPTERFEEILRVPGLSLYRVGRGTLVALAMPRLVDCDSPRAISLLARLLTNLGVPLGGAGREETALSSRRGR